MPQPPAVPRSITGVMAVDFAAGGALLPFVALYLRDQGFDAREQSQIYMVSNCIATITPFVCGVIADRFLALDRLIALLNLVAAVGIFWFLNVESAMAVAVAYSVYYGAFQPLLNLLNALCYHHMKDPKAQYGYVRAWGSMGWIVPSFGIWIWLVRTGDSDLSFAFVCAGGLCAVMALVALVLLPSTPPAARSRGRSADDLPYVAALGRLLGRPGFAPLLVGSFLASMSFVVFFYYSALHLEDVGVPRAWVGPIQCLTVAVEIPLFFKLRRFIGRFGHARTIAIGCVALAARHLIFSVSEDPALLIGSYAIAGFFVVFYFGGASLYGERLAEPEVRSTAQTLVALAGPGLGSLAGHALAAQIAGPEGDFASLFAYSAVCAGLAAVVFLWFLRDAQLRG